jgi:uncharacterized protein DUF7002
MGIKPDEIAGLFPRLYHMAQLGSWPCIERHGLLSTSALLDLFEVGGTDRERIESTHRPESIPIRHPLHGAAVIRDQKPMSDAGLRRALRDGMTPEGWYRSLNSRVFFWLTEDRLQKLLNARAYRKDRHTVLTIETRLLLQRHEDRISLSPINSGCTMPFPQPRGASTFLRPSQYPFDEWRRKRLTHDSIVELAVDYGVEDVRDVVLEVKETGGGDPDTLLWRRD